MADFEKAIINACQQVYPGVELTCGFFHLGQSVYRQVQALGLQQAYNDPDNETIRVYTHAMLALAYVPEAEVGLLFQLLSDNPNLYDTAFWILWPVLRHWYTCAREMTSSGIPTPTG